MSGKRTRDEQSPLVREDSTKQPAKSSLVSTSEEISFPRGGASALTPLELKQVANEAASDVLFGDSKKEKSKQAVVTSGKRPSKKRKTKAENELAEVVVEEDNFKNVTQHISFKNLKVGSQLLGQISEVTRDDLCVVFTDGISGYVSLANISEQMTSLLESLDTSMSDSEDDNEDKEYDSSDDESDKVSQQLQKQQDRPNLQNYFKIGEWLRCSITSNSALESQTNKKKKKRIELSIEPSAVNSFSSDDLNKFCSVQCSVKSIEDHGAILDLGIENVTGFIAKKDHMDFDSLKVGSVFLANVAKKTDRTVTVNTKFSLKNQKFTSIASVDSVVPGQLVDFLCQNISSNGIVGKVFGLVPGFISDVHLKTFSEDDIKHKFAVGSSFQVRIIASMINNENEKTLIVSTLPHIQKLDKIFLEKENLEAFPVGYTFENASVKGRDSYYLLLSLDEDRIGQVHNSKIGSAVDSKSIKARVLGFSSIDNSFQLSTDPDTLKLKYLRATDIKIGELLPNCEIVTVSTKGIELKIFNDQFRAFVPSLHISDTKLVYPERKFKIGSKVKARVINVTPKNRIFVTLKKSLVNVEETDSTTFISSYKDAAEMKEKNEKIVASVQQFKPNGAIVSFFGHLSGFLPNAEISEAFVKRPEEHLRLGQTIVVKILDVDATKNRIITTCKISNDNGDIHKATIEKLQPGRSIVEVLIIEKTRDSLIVEIENAGLRGVIYVGHLSDQRIEQNRAALKKIKIGSRINGLIIDKDPRTHVFNMTLKESMIEDSKNNVLPLEYSDIKSIEKSTPLHGYIKSISNNGIFVAFIGKFVGLVLPSYAVVSKDVDIKKTFYVNQSVTAHILKTDDEQERFLLTLKPSKVSTKPEETDINILENPIDPSVKRISDLVVNKVLKAKVKGVKKNQLNVILADNVHGRVDVSEVFDTFSEVKDKQQPLSNFKSGDIITVKILGQHSVKTHKFLPISHSTLTKSVLELSLKPSKLKKSKSVSLNIENVKVGDQITGFINNYHNNVLWLTISPILKAKLSLFELSNDRFEFENIEDRFPIGSAMNVHIKSIDTEHNYVNVSNKLHSITSIDDIKINDTLPARISKVTDMYALLDLGNNITGISFITEALSDYSKSMQETFGDKLNLMVNATVLKVDPENRKINLSLRSNDSKRLESHNDIKSGDIVNAIVKNITEKGIFVFLSSSLEAFIPVSKLSDMYLKDWKKFYKPAQHVVGKVVSCNENSRILLTLRESEINGKIKFMKTYADIKAGDIFSGHVKNVTDFGVFVKLDDTLNVSGLAHRTEVANKVPEDLSALFGVGDKVKAKVLKVDVDKKQLSLSLKASHFITEDATTEKTIAADSDYDEIMDSVNFNNDSEEEEESDIEIEKTIAPISTDGLSLSAGFDWTTNILNQALSEDESDDDEEDFTERKRSKHKKKKLQVLEDKTIDINTRAPESVDDFERLIMGNPNSSVIWMNYMAFQLQLSEIDKAREIAERALKIINFRDENEKLNIWISMLNLENTFGTEDTLEDVFKRSCQYMDSFVMHNKLLSIYEMSSKPEKAAQLFKVTAKKFGSEKVSIWVSWGKFLLSIKEEQEARSVLGKALKALPKFSHVEVVRKFAQLEFNKGDPERGRSLFEGLIADAPKRIDIWNVYIDQEIKVKQVKKVRDLFERVIGKKVTRKQAKFFFNKWLQFEEAQKDSKAISYVKAKAVAFVEANPKASEQ